MTWHFCALARTFDQRAVALPDWGRNRLRVMTICSVKICCSRGERRRFRRSYYIACAVGAAAMRKILFVASVPLDSFAVAA